MTCTLCKKRPADPGFRRCGCCRERQCRSARAYYARHRKLHPAPVRVRALRMLSMFVLTPTELADALNITPEHAATTLLRLMHKGYCRRFVSGKLACGKPALRYQLSDGYRL